MKIDDNRTAEVVPMHSHIQATGRGLELRSYDDMRRYAADLAGTDFCPKEYRGKPVDCMVAMQYGMELGLSIMASLRSIAVINGKPSIYGDGLLAVCQGSPAFDHAVFQEFESGEGDQKGWTCRVGRVGGTTAERRFTIADAKQAKLWGKSGPWTFYPSRMLQMRCRGFALRDMFSDILSGIISREEAMDYPTPRPAFNPEEVQQAMTLPVEDRPALPEHPVVDSEPPSERTPPKPPPAPANETTTKGEPPPPKSDGETIGRTSNLYGEIEKALHAVPAKDRDMVRKRLKFTDITEIADWTETDARSALDLLMEYQPTGAKK